MKAALVMLARFLWSIIDASRPRAPFFPGQVGDGCVPMIEERPDCPHCFDPINADDAVRTVGDDGTSLAGEVLHEACARHHALMVAAYGARPATPSVGCGV